MKKKCPYLLIRTFFFLTILFTMIEFKEYTPTISQIYQYTYMNRKTKSRFEYEERDILKSKIYIQRRISYKKNKEGKFTAPDERLLIHTESTPQYYPYIKVKSKKALKQRKIHHEYDCVFVIQKDYKNEYNYWNSKVIFRIGSNKKYPKSIPQNKIKSIKRETRERIEKRYSKLPYDERRVKVSKEFEKIRKRGKYLDASDYVAQEYGINGDFYFRDAFIMSKYGCLYGRDWYGKACDDVSFPFFPKHAIACINFLLRKGILKY